MSAALTFDVAGQTLPARISTLVIAGWAGRDEAAVRHHIEELQAIGVKPPRETPLFYRLGAGLLTQEKTVQLVGRGSTGEAEAVLLHLPEGLFVTVGSDHTDREAEAAGVTWSKQMCPKPVGHAAWAFEELRARWDSLRLSSRVQRDGVWVDYQSGVLAGLRHPDDLLARHTLPVGGAMFLGTLPVHGPIAWADVFEARLEDPATGAALTCRYMMEALPIND